MFTSSRRLALAIPALAAALVAPTSAQALADSYQNPVNPPHFKMYAGCAYGGPFYAPAIRPSIRLLQPGLDGGPTTVRAEVKVTVDSTGSLANWMSLEANERKFLSTPRGGFTVNAKVLFSDGTTKTIVGAVPKFDVIAHDYNVFNAGASNCRNGNDLYGYVPQ